MREIIGTVELDAPGAPTTGFLTQLGYGNCFGRNMPDDTESYRDLTVFLTSDPEHPFVPVRMSPATVPDMPSLGPRIDVGLPFRVAPNIDEAQDPAAAELDVRFGQLPPRGSESYKAIILACAREALRHAGLSHELQAPEGEFVIQPLNQSREEIVPAEPRVGDLVEYYTNGTPIPVRMDLSGLFPDRSYSVEAPRETHPHVQVRVRDTTTTTTVRDETEMTMRTAPFALDESAANGLQYDNAGVQKLTLRVAGRPRIKLDESGRQIADITEAYVPAFVRIAYRLSRMVHDAMNAE